MNYKNRHVDWLAVGVGAGVFICATAIGTFVAPYVETYGFNAGLITTCAQIGGGILALAGLAGKRILS